MKLVTPALLLVSLNAIAAGADCDSTDSVENEIRCLQIDVKEADTSMQHYLTAIMRRHPDTHPLTSRASAEPSQNLWLKWRESRCRKVGLRPRDDAKLEAQYLRCRYIVTRERTHELWEKYLKRSDGGPPELPEPLL